MKISMQIDTGYIGFMENEWWKYQPSLVLGSANRKYRWYRSFIFIQVMPRINGVDQLLKAIAKFGISKGEMPEGTIWSKLYSMHNTVASAAYIQRTISFFKTWIIYFWIWKDGAPGYGLLCTTTEPTIFVQITRGSYFKRKGSDYKIHFVNGATDHDLIDAVMQW